MLFQLQEIIYARYNKILLPLIVSTITIISGFNTIYL